MYKGSACYDPTHLKPLTYHQDDSQTHQPPNFTSIEPSTDFHLMNMEIIHDQIQAENDSACLQNTSLITPNLTTPDLLNCSNSSLYFSNPTNMDQTSYDPFATEKHSRQRTNDTYHALRNLIPNPTKGPDRASVLKDAIIYINELKRTAEELKVLVQRKRCNKERMKKHKVKNDLTLDVKSIDTRPNGGSGGNGDHDRKWYNGTLKYMCCVLIVLMLIRMFILYIC